MGKTTLALSFLGLKATTKHPGYLNWDYGPSSEAIRHTRLPIKQSTLIFDELHKFKNWKRWIKGVIDVEGGSLKMIVTGSARLDLYKKGGDSLFGRYRYIRLHPFSLPELTKLKIENSLERLLIFGGFPEPFFSCSPRELKLWQKERLRRLIREDVRDISVIQDLASLESMAELLPSKVGNPLSVQSLSEDIQVDHKTIKRWLIVLESMYYCFRISPFGSPKIRAVKKEQKLYLWDWSIVEDPESRWENLVASQLLKYCHFMEDSEGESMELRFIRDIDKREVDFVVLKNKKPVFAVECKSGEKAIGRALYYFAERTSIPVFYQVHRGQACYRQGKISVLPFAEFCKELDMP